MIGIGLLFYWYVGGGGNVKWITLRSLAVWRPVALPCRQPHGSLDLICLKINKNYFIKIQFGLHENNQTYKSYVRLEPETEWAALRVHCR